MAETVEKEIEAVLQRYFATWSNADMKGYGRLFHPSANVYFLDRNNRPQHYRLEPFVAGQAEFLKQAQSPTREIPTRIHITASHKLARAEVDWQMTVGARQTTGVDYFTLIRTPGGWQILTLIFYQY